MLKKLSAVGVSCVTALVLMLSALASPASVDAVTLEQMTSTAIECIISHEGTYDSINPNDCGAVSVGKLQWHADRALALMRKTCEKNPAFAETTLGTTFYNEVMSATNWNYRTFSSSEAAAAAVLLGSEYGIQAQDETAAADVQNYIISGQNMGLTDAGALVLYADIYNFGCGIASRIAKRAASYTGSYASVTLDDMYKAALNDSYGSNATFVSRTNKVYAYLSGLDWDASVTTTVTTTAPAIIFTEDGAGTYTVTASSLNMRSGPGTGYSILTQIPNGAAVTVTATGGNWAAVTYGSFEGYCSMDYLVEDVMTTTAATAVTTTPTATEETTEATTTTTTTALAETTTEVSTEAETTETVETTTETTTSTVMETTEATATDAVIVTETSTTEETAETTTTTTAVLGDVIVNSAYATLYGDINCDGAVNVADAVLLHKYLCGTVQLNLEQIANGDCSYDHELSSTDVIIILQHLVGHYTALPIM
ncbi:MAG: SH3 domain-containing protein [Ruminococcus sp.]|nr:SH3 domain-containing protein [Ruminococcus sp.]